MEDEETRALAENDLKGFLNRYPQGLVIDEAHHLPRLFSALQVMVDDDDSKRFVLSGSSNFLMLRNISQSLAGGVAITRGIPAEPRFRCASIGGESGYHSFVAAIIARVEA